jgi:dTDP-4-dehydrorhamnose reductase
VGRPTFNFSDSNTILSLLNEIKPDVVVNAGAFTNVDLAETAHVEADTCNWHGVYSLSERCRILDINLIHISTDYVFSGDQGRPYTEEDKPAPLNYYGRSKYLGEQAMLASGVSGVIIRTAWLYSDLGSNFLTRILAQCALRRELRYVIDQTGCPTSAYDLAEATLQIAEHLVMGWRPNGRALFHAVGRSSASAYEFAQACVDPADQLRVGAVVRPVLSSERISPARRPADTRLSTEQLQSVFGISLPPWQESLPRLLQMARTAIASS